MHIAKAVRRAGPVDMEFGKQLVPHQGDPAFAGGMIVTCGSIAGPPAGHGAALAYALEQLRGFEQRQPDDAGIAAVNGSDERGRMALDGIAAGFARPIRRCRYRRSISDCGQPRENDAAVAEPVAGRPSGAISVTAVSTWWRRPESSVRHARACVARSGLAQNAAAHRDHGIGGQREAARRRDSRGLFARQASA